MAAGPIAASAGELDDAISAGKLLLDVRARYEFAEQDGFARDAHSKTIRTRFGFESGAIKGFKILVEAENVAYVGQDGFNSTTNGETGFPVVADPEAFEINRAQLTFTGVPDTEVTIGRQRLNLNNQRYVGGVAFRQNEQTFDAARIVNKGLDRLTLQYVYIDRVHRIFGDDNPLGEFDSDSHLAEVEVDAGQFGVFLGYAYLLDLAEAPAESSATFGLRTTNTIPTPLGVSIDYVAEFARQSERDPNPRRFDLTYLHGEVAASYAFFTVTGGYEWLEGDGAQGFSTPLATLHKFQGLADAFLTTPADGIKDAYAGVSLTHPAPPFGKRIVLAATYHDFSAGNGAGDLGSEWDATLNFTLSKRLAFETQAAFFDGAGAGPPSRTRVTLSLDYKF